MREIIVIWIAIILVVASVLFPPYGYTTYTTQLAHRGAPPSNAEQAAFIAIMEKETRYVEPWKYVEHRFIFSGPPMTDWKRFEKKRKLEGLNEDVAYRLYSVEDMRIAWPVMAVEVFVIILVASGFVLTFRIRRKRVS